MNPKIIRLFNQLPEPYCSEAIQNYKKRPWIDNVKSLSSAIWHAFTWSDTPEGYGYWLHIYLMAKDGKLGNPLQAEIDELNVLLTQIEESLTT